MSLLYANLRSLFTHLSRRRCWQLAGLTVFMLIGAITEMATLGAIVPFFALLADPTFADNQPLLQILFGYLGLNDGDDLFVYLSLIFILLVLFSAGIRVILTWASCRFTQALGVDIGSEVYRRTLYQPYSFHVGHNSSEIIAGINKVNSVVNSVISPLLQMMVALITSIGILAVLFIVDSFSATVAIGGFSLLYFLASVSTHRTLHANSIVIAESHTRRLQAIQEGLGGIRDVLIEAAQPIYVARYRKFDHAMRRAQAVNMVISATPRFIVEAVGMVLIIGLAFWLNHRSGGLATALPILGALALGAQKLLPRMQALYNGWAQISGNYAVLADVLALLSQPIPAEYLQATQDDSLHLTERITLRNVCFRYNNDAPAVIHNLSLVIQRGSRVGFVGKTGSGKSTLIDIIMGLLEPTEGCIEIDGQTLCCDNRRSWQKRIAHVPQAVYLSDTSIAENIAFGIPPEKIDHQRVCLSAEKAQLSGFIETLPQQYQTLVGERGVRLSGGQCQRIGIARALYKQVEVLILDEATSALDDATEASVMQVIEALGKDITVLMIAHRLSTLRNFDELIEL